MKDKLGAVGVSGRDPADNEDDYTLEYRILCPDICDPIAVPFHHFKKMSQHGNHSSFFHKFLGSNDKGTDG